MVMNPLMKSLPARQALAAPPIPSPLPEATPSVLGKATQKSQAPSSTMVVSAPFPQPLARPAPQAQPPGGPCDAVTEMLSRARLALESGQVVLHATLRPPGQSALQPGKPIATAYRWSRMSRAERIRTIYRVAGVDPAEIEAACRFMAAVEAEADAQDAARAPLEQALADAERARRECLLASGVTVSSAVVPAAQAIQPADAATPPATTDLQTGDIDERGRLVGVDGILDQVGEALRRQVEPMVRDTVLPVIQRDVALQREVGAAAGQALAREIKPWVVLGVGILAFMAYQSWSKSR